MYKTHVLGNLCCPLPPALQHCEDVKSRFTAMRRFRHLQWHLLDVNGGQGLVLRIARIAILTVIRAVIIATRIEIIAVIIATRIAILAAILATRIAIPAGIL